MELTQYEYIERKIAEFEAKHGEMPAHNKQMYREVLRKEHEFWEAWDARKDNSRGRDDQ